MRPRRCVCCRLALTRPRFDAEAVSRVRAQIIQSLQQDREPSRRTWRGAAFMRDVLRRPSLCPSRRRRVGSVSADHARRICSNFATQPLGARAASRSRWRATSPPPALTKLLADTFQPVSGAMPAAAAADVGRLGAPGVHVMPHAGAAAHRRSSACPASCAHDPDFIPGYVANYILGGGGFSSRLTDEVRVKRGLTYGISTSLTAYQQGQRACMGSVATRADAVRQTMQVVRDTMAEFAANGPTQQELDDAKTYLTGSFPLAFASNAGIASQLGTFQRAGPGYRLCRPAQRPDPGGDPGRCEAGGQARCSIPRG